MSQIQALLAKVEAGGGLTPEVRTTLDDLQTLSAQAGAVAKLPLAVQPWLLAMAVTVLGDWGQVVKDVICCTYCGSSEVACKSKKTRKLHLPDCRRADACRLVRLEK